MKLNKILPVTAAAALPAVCTVRAVKAKKELPDMKPAISFTSEEKMKYAENLSEMIKIPTISKKEGEEFGDFLKLQEKMAELFPHVFSELENHDLDGNILRKWKGSDPSKGAILFMGHQDVVPVDQAGWTKEPFSGAIENGLIHGRGAMDCKSTVCCEFSAVEELLSEGFVPEEDIWLFASKNEENSGGGSEKAVEYLQSKGIRFNFVMDEGGAIVGDIFPGLSAPCAAIGIVEKGFCNVKFIARGSGGHASTPPDNSPFIRLSKFMVEAEKKKPFKKELSVPVPQMLESVTPYLGFPLRFVLSNMWLFKGAVKTVFEKVSGQTRAFISTTAAFTMSGGSTAPNVLPDEAYVICNIRPSVAQNAEESIAALKKIADKYDIETEVLMARDASGISSPDSDEMAYMKKCINACMPDCVVTPYLMTGGTDSRQFEVVSDNVLRFCPTRLTSEQLDAMHAANENINIDALAEGVKTYKYIIEHRGK